MTTKARIAIERLRGAAWRYFERREQALKEERILIDQLMETLYRGEDLLDKLEDVHQLLRQAPNHRFEKEASEDDADLHNHS